ncbi:MAG: hypothetical protein NTX29_11220 [Actinobacteria bacterium]|nr:hypothetical protein [Actinomycetota bacterium]
MAMPLASRILARFGVAALIVGCGALATGSSAHAADGSPDLGRYQRVQPRVDYTVYGPTTSFGLPRTSFQVNSCGGGRSDFITADYGKQATATSPWLSLQESPGSDGCVDGPDGVGPAATFTVNGARAHVLGSCAGGKSTCAHSTAALVKKQAYTIVTLPGSADRPTKTHVEVYSQAMTLAQIKAFIRGLVPAT